MLGMTPAGTTIVLCVALFAALLLAAQVVSAVRDVRVGRELGRDLRQERRVSTGKAPEERHPPTVKARSCCSEVGPTNGERHTPGCWNAPAASVECCEAGWISKGSRHGPECEKSS